MVERRHVVLGWIGLAATVGCAQLDKMGVSAPGRGGGGAPARPAPEPARRPEAEPAPAPASTSTSTNTRSRDPNPAPAPAPAAAVDPARSAAARDDERWLVDTWTRLQPRIEEGLAVRYPSHHIGTEGAYREIRAEALARLKALEPFEASFREALERLDAIDARWGPPGASKDGSSNLNLYSDKVGAALAVAQGRKANDGRPAYEAHYGLRRRGGQLVEWREKACAEMVADVDRYLAENAWVRYGEARATLELAQRMRPGDALAARLRGWDAEVAKHRADNAARLDAQAVPGHIMNFSGPGDPDALARSAVEFLTAPDDYSGSVWFYDHQGPWTFHRAAVRGQWTAEETVLGRVTQWCVLLEVVLSDREMEQDGVAAVVPFWLICAQHADRATGWVQGKWAEDMKKRAYVRLAKAR